ncbi:MAG: hypothetical protein AB7H66_01580 [Hyphomonadaceae bacterium]
MADGAVPIQESVGAALRFVRENLRFVGAAALIGAVGSVAVSGLAFAVPQAGIVTMIASGLVQAFVYAALVGCALFGAEAARTRWRTDGWRVWAAMVLIGFFLFIVMLVMTIPVSIVLAAGPLAPYAAELQSVGGDQQAVMRIMMQFMQDNPMAVFLVLLFYSAIWFLLTSRLYLAAPASVDAGRMLTFETWKWTRGAVLRITAARLLLLAPAYILAGALGHLIGLMFGVDTLNPASIAAAAASNPVGLLAFDFLRALIVLLLYAPLEAGLSSYLYRGLKPADAAPPA